MSKKNKEYEFEVYCPRNDCRRGILFNRNLLNISTACPTCKQEVYLCLSKIQPPGMSHIVAMKKRAMRLWERKHKDAAKWAECVDEVMSHHRQRILNPELYSRYRPT